VRHHEDTIAAYAAHVIDQPDTLALIVVGSVARGTARPTSDVDVYLVITDDAFAAAQSASRVAYLDTEAATYDTTSISSSPARATWSGRWRTRTIPPGPRFSMLGSFSTTPDRWPRPLLAS
jgi:hypothetical protein